jgi:hypothetical protein
MPGAGHSRGKSSLDHRFDAESGWVAGAECPGPCALACAAARNRDEQRQLPESGSSWPRRTCDGLEMVERGMIRGKSHGFFGARSNPPRIGSARLSRGTIEAGAERPSHSSSRRRAGLRILAAPGFASKPQPPVACLVATVEGMNAVEESIRSSGSRRRIGSALAGVPSHLPALPIPDVPTSQGRRPRGGASEGAQSKTRPRSVI